MADKRIAKSSTPAPASLPIETNSSRQSTEAIVSATGEDEKSVSGSVSPEEHSDAALVYSNNLLELLKSWNQLVLHNVLYNKNYAYLDKAFCWIQRHAGLTREQVGTSHVLNSHPTSINRSSTVARPSLLLAFYFSASYFCLLAHFKW